MTQQKASESRKCEISEIEKKNSGERGVMETKKVQVVTELSAPRTLNLRSNNLLNKNE